MINFKNLAGGVAFVAMSAALVQAAHAQVTTSAVRGVVTDQAGAAVPSAVVIVTHTPSGTVSTASTNESGVFSARGLRVGGPYTIEVTGNGFTPIQVTDVYINVDETFPVELVVNNLAGQDVVVITGSVASGGEYLNTGLTTFLAASDIEDIASIDRDIADAARRDPFAVINIQSGGPKELSIAGANNRYNSLTIDGVALNDRFGLNANGYPTQRSPISVDAIESLQVLSAPYGTEYNGFTGGSINVVTKSGTNEFRGSVFGSYTDDSLTGDSIRGVPRSLDFEETTWGATLGGPIIEDQLFFFLAYDSFEETAPLVRGPIGSGALNEVNVTAADISQIRQILIDDWNFDPGEFGGLPPAVDEKVLASLDWNINDRHRAKFTYLQTEGNTIIEQNGNSFVQGAALGFPSSWYDRSEKVTSYIGHLYSDWTDDFSTEVKLAFTDQETGQDSLNGAEFPLFSVRTSTGVVVALGPDTFRHANQLDQQFSQIKLKAEYVMGDHTFKAGYEREEADVDNLFGPQSEGSYAFSSIANLQAHLASSMNYQNAVTNDENDLRAIWGYNYNSLYAEDVWDVLDNLSVQYGLRYDWYESDGAPRLNQNFLDRYGYANTKTVDGLEALLPRLSFTWDATDSLSVRGGIGRFSGGSPGVWVSNSYSNDGVIGDQVRATNVVVPTIPDPVTGNYIPAAQLTQLATKAPDGVVNALDPTFDIPATWKANIGLAWNGDIGPLTDWTLSADVLYNKLENAPWWYDASCGQPIGTMPDGRPRYNCGADSPNDSDTLSDPEAVVVGSVDKGHALLFALAANKTFDFGLDLFASYTYMDVNDIGMGNSSTASSNYSDFARYSWGFPRTGTSAFQTEHLFKLDMNYQFELVENFPTTVALFAQRRSGQPYSYTFDFPSGSQSAFGIRRGSEDDSGHLFYVPSGPTDPLFSPNSFGGSAAAQQAFFDYIDSSELSQYKGSITPQNGDNSRWITTIDLHLEQEIPSFIEGHSAKAFLDIENLGNLINDDWGIVERTQYEYERRVATATVSNGQYVYNNLLTPSQINNLEIQTRSLWQIQVGAKYEF